MSWIQDIISRNQLFLLKQEFGNCQPRPILPFNDCHTTLSSGNLLYFCLGDEQRSINAGNILFT